MIFRKPFAFLIKRFKLIHMILSIFIGILLIRTSNMLGFYIDYIKNGQSSISTSITTDFFDFTLIISILIILLGNILIAYLMKFKEKPIVFYIFNIFVYLTLIGVYYYTFTVTQSLEVGLVDIRTLKLVQDLLTLGFIFQWLSIITMLIRSFGFDVKKFDFRKDLEELEIKDKDSEEFEVDVQFDSDDFKRKLNKSIRHLKYAYQENKFVIRIVVLITLLIVGVVLYLKFNVYDNSYQQGQAFSSEKFNIMVTNSYVTDTSNNDNVISKDSSYVIIGINIKAFNDEGVKFQTSGMALEINKHKFYYKKNYKDLFKEFGNSYLNQKIYQENKNYTLIYKIPDGYKKEKMILKYSLGNGEIEIKLNPKRDSKDKSFSYKLNDVIKFDESLLKDTTLQLTNFEIKSKFKVDYKQCVSKEECYDSYEYIKANYTGNGDKILLKLNGNLNWSLNNNIEPVNDLYEFISTYGNVVYKIGTEEKKMLIPIIEVKPTKVITSDTYIEVPKEVENADNIYLIFKVRDKIYKYIVK